MIGLKRNLVHLAQYNQWANEIQFQNLAMLEAVSEEILEHLNHILMGDSLWLNRFSKHPIELKSLLKLSDVPTVIDITKKPFLELEGLKKWRGVVDSILIEFTQELSVEHMSSDLAYSFQSEEKFSFSFPDLIQHLLNHHVHHNAQINTLIKRAGAVPPAIDLIYFMIDKKKS